MWPGLVEFLIGGSAAAVSSLHSFAVHFIFGFLLRDLFPFNTVVLSCTWSRVPGYVPLLRPLRSRSMVEMDQVADVADASLTADVGIHKCLYANVRGLRQGAGELAAMVTAEKPHFIFLTECHIAKREPINMWVPHGYKVAVKRWRTAHGGGLLVMVQEHLLCDVFNTDDYHIDEAAELVGINFGGVTYLNAYSNKSSVCDQLIKVLKRVKQDYPDVKFVMVGDFNVHNSDWIHSSHTDDAGELLEAFVQLNGMLQLVNFPTREENTLDLIISDFDGEAYPAAHIGTSDHVSILFEIKVAAAVPTDDSMVKTRSWRRAPWNHIRGHIKRAVEGWKPNINHTTSEAEYELDDLLWKVVDKHVKWKLPTQPRSRPWWTARCQRAYKQKLKAFSSRKQHPAKYNNIKKRCSRVQKRAYFDYNKNLSKRLRSMEKSDGKFWDLTKQISGLQQQRSRAAPDANQLVDHFADKMSNGANEFDNDWKPPNHWKGKAKISNFKVHKRDVLRILKSLDTNKSMNGIPYLLLKECAQELCEPLTLLYRFICKKGEFPERWKVGRITALHKRGPISSPKMYRPVQVLINGELVFEGVIGPQLVRFLQKFIPASQFGFIKRCGTQDYGVLLVLLIFSALERGNQVLIISLDVAGAFDRVWHAGLLKKLAAAGMNGKAFKLIKSYLQRRSIEVVVGAVKSEQRRIYSSVPQGGKWSAPLWDFEISTLEDLDLQGWLMSYADDCSLVYEITSQNSQSMVAAVNQDLAQLESWGVQWHVSFEPSKTHSMVVSRKSKVNTFKPDGIVFMEKPIEPVDQMKLVGFVFDPKMTMEPMINHVARKARVKLGAIGRLQQHLDSKNLEIMFKSFVRSSLEYGNLVYMSAGSSYKERLDHVQHAAEKMCQFKIESLESRRHASLIGFVFKLLDGGGRGMLNDFIPTISHKQTPNDNRSQRSQISHIEHVFDYRDTSKQYDRSIGGQIPVVWGKIPQELLQRGADGWRSSTKNCQRFLTGKKLATSKKKNRSKNSKCEQKIIAASASLMSDSNTVLNNELNVKVDFKTIAAELKSLGINFNKSLLTL